MDVYRVHLRSKQTLVALVRASTAGVELLLWKPGTRQVTGPPRQLARNWSRRRRAFVGKTTRIPHASGWYYLEVKMIAQDEATYRLRVAKLAP